MSAHFADHRQPPAIGEALSRVRFVGVDVARFLAIVGMMAAHLITIVEWNPDASEFDLAAADVTNTLTEGIAAPLFAVLGGLSSVFATRRLLRDRRPGSAVAAIALRGGLLIALGLLLGMIENPVVVVLAYYGAAMILVAPLIAAPGLLIGAVALLLDVVGGPLNAAARVALDVNGYEGRSVTFETFGDDWVMAVRALLLTGIYPAITWVVYLLAGILIGRLLVRATSRGRLMPVSVAISAGGAVSAIAAAFVSARVLADPASAGFDPATATVGAGSLTPEGGFDIDLLAELVHGAPPSTDLWAQLIAMPHSGSPLDIARTLGIACAVIGLLVALCDRTPRTLAGSEGMSGSGSVATTAPARSRGRLLETIRSAGAAPLTIYTLHIVATGWLLGPLMTDPQAIFTLQWWAAGLGAFVLQLAAVLVIGAILAAIGRRGPLEAAMSGIVKLVVRG